MAVGSIPPGESAPDVFRIRYFRFNDDESAQKKEYEDLLNRINAIQEAEVIDVDKRISEKSGEYIVVITYKEPLKKSPSAKAKKKTPIR